MFDGILGGIIDAVTGGAVEMGTEKFIENVTGNGDAGGENPQGFVYERVLTRPRDPSINDR